MKLESCFKMMLLLITLFTCSNTFAATAYFTGQVTRVLNHLQFDTVVISMDAEPAVQCPGAPPGRVATFKVNSIKSDAARERLVQIALVSVYTKSQVLIAYDDEVCNVSGEHTNVLFITAQ